MGDGFLPGNPFFLLINSLAGWLRLYLFSVPPRSACHSRRINWAAGHGGPFFLVPGRQRRPSRHRGRDAANILSGDGIVRVQATQRVRRRARGHREGAAAPHGLERFYRDRNRAPPPCRHGPACPGDDDRGAGAYGIAGTRTGPAAGSACGMRRGQAAVSTAAVEGSAPDRNAHSSAARMSSVSSAPVTSGSAAERVPFCRGKRSQRPRA